MIFKSYEIQRNLGKFSKYNFFLCYGENFGLKLDIKETIKNSIDQKDSEIESLSFYEDDIIENQESFYNNIYSGSLFGNKKLISINNCTDKIINQIEDIISKYPENVFIIIFSDILEKKSKLRNFFEKDSKTACIACYLDTERDLEIIAQNKLKNSGISISKESMNLLIAQSNNDRNNLKNELEKIISYSLDKKDLTIEEVKSLVNFSGEYKSDILINECLCGNVSQYKKIVAELYSNAVNQIFLLRILDIKIQKLLSMKKNQESYSNLDSLINSSKPPIFWKEKPVIKKQLNIWSLDALKKIVNELNSVEILCKKNPQISKVIFFNFFSNICKKASSSS